MADKHYEIEVTLKIKGYNSLSAPSQFEAIKRINDELENKMNLGGVPLVQKSAEWEIKAHCSEDD